MFNILYKDEIDEIWNSYHPITPSSSVPLATPIQPSTSSPQPVMNNGGIASSIPEDNRVIAPNPALINTPNPATQIPPSPSNPQPAVGGTMIIGVVESEKNDNITLEKVMDITLKAFSTSKDKDDKINFNKLLNTMDDIAIKEKEAGNAPKPPVAANDKPNEKKEEPKTNDTIKTTTT